MNDLNMEVVNFFRVAQSHHDELIRYMRFAVVSRELYAIFQRQDPRTLTDIQRAARFLYLQKNSFGGLIHDQHYHRCVVRPPNFNLERLPDLLEATARRLARVQIESAPYEEILSSYDRESTFFYCDPPYVGVKLYRFNFADQDFSLLADRLAGIKGKFLLSINDHPVARKAFERFELREIRLSYTSARSVPTVQELLVANYALPTDPVLASRSAGGRNVL